MGVEEENAAAIRDLAMRTGLKKETIEDLLEHNWVFRAGDNMPSAFLDPSYSLQMRRMER